MGKRKVHRPAPVWDGGDYIRVTEGRYQAVATRHQGPDWIRAFARWSLLVEFELLSEDARVCVFYNFGNDRSGPKIGRRSKYFQAWTRANGGLPRKGQEMSPDVFLGQLFTIEVRDCRRNEKEEDKVESEVYSKVTEIVSVDHPSLDSPNQESLNQKSGNQESSNHPIEESTNQVWPALRKDTNSDA